jgi:hypothetical protein
MASMKSDLSTLVTSIDVATDGPTTEEQLDQMRQQLDGSQIKTMIEAQQMMIIELQVFLEISMMRSAVALHSSQVM